LQVGQNFRVGDAKDSGYNFGFTYEARPSAGLLLGKLGKSGKQPQNLNQMLQEGGKFGVGRARSVEH
jgi:hypothetical protein